MRKSLIILLALLFAMQLGPACGFATVVMPNSMNCCQSKCPIDSSRHHAGCCQVSATSDKAVAQASVVPQAALLSASVGAAVSSLMPIASLQWITYRSLAPPPQTALALLCSRQI